MISPSEQKQTPEKTQDTLLFLTVNVYVFLCDDSSLLIATNYATNVATNLVTNDKGQKKTETKTITHSS
jgi:hypothetical protein